MLFPDYFITLTPPHPPLYICLYPLNISPPCLLISWQHSVRFLMTTFQSDTFFCLLPHIQIKTFNNIIITKYRHFYPLLPPFPTSTLTYNTWCLNCIKKYPLPVNLLVPPMVPSPPSPPSKHFQCYLSYINPPLHSFYSF